MPYSCKSHTRATEGARRAGQHSHGHRHYRLKVSVRLLCPSCISSTYYLPRRTSSMDGGQISQW
jgi:hypothetical protein